MFGVSVIICTRNRAESLRSTLNSFAKLNVPEDLIVELLVVDNGSSDHTEQVVRRISFSQMPVKYIREPRVGKSHAYNTAIAGSVGEVLLFTDDDVRVPTNWLDGMCRPIFQGGADAVAGGVVIPPDIDCLIEQRLLKNRRGWVASTHELDPHQPCRMVGANMAFHRRVLDKVSSFDVELGPGPEGLGNFEDTIFSWQLLSAGYELVGALDVVVEHHFDLKRLSCEELIDSARKMGRSHAFIFHHWKHQKSKLVIPRLLLCRIMRYWMRCVNHGNKSRTNISDRAIQLEYDLAFYKEYLLQRRRQFKYPLSNHLKRISCGQF
jgi:glycosyltransferase involved in cell wall biosynthesis